VSPTRRTAPTPPVDLGLEGRIVSDDHQSLKVWLRLLSCSNQIETTIRRRLRQEAGITLARFDFMAQLHRHPEGLTMSVLSRYLMVTGGNVTGLADELEKEGLVERTADPADRRTSRVTLTRKGRRLFDRMATMHEAWVATMFREMSAVELRQLYDTLGRLRSQLAAQESDAPAAATTASSTTTRTSTARRRRRTGATT
jgi:DNA-binding MarR family transcriptional regulator